MELAEFDVLADQMRQRSASLIASAGFSLIDGRTAAMDQIRAAEDVLGAILPEKYTAFMTQYGGGRFGFVDLFSIAAGDPDDICAINHAEFPDAMFIAIAPVGTGDHWGFPVTDGRCHDQVWFHFHDGGDPELVAADFLEFAARHGLKS
ncbi:SMI1/KNR4 family protein [Hamadaea tsunoensis]|uniref:SMI1/KNR4 family protein n=1 Tax=Hamadaea tsunoensis TaxID=53368 RepID=UPI000415833D|nr:SMI1/KNR4 family protein [Hamadaea tsunoensis]